MPLDSWFLDLGIFLDFLIKDQVVLCAPKIDSAEGGEKFFFRKKNAIFKGFRAFFGKIWKKIRKYSEKIRCCFRKLSEMCRYFCSYTEILLKKRLILYIFRKFRKPSLAVSESDIYLSEITNRILKPRNK